MGFGVGVFDQATIDILGAESELFRSEGDSQIFHAGSSEEAKYNQDKARCLSRNPKNGAPRWRWIRSGQYSGKCESISSTKKEKEDKWGIPDIIPDVIIDIIDDVKATWNEKIAPAFGDAWDFLTVGDAVIGSTTTVTRCCNGVPRRFEYALYQVNADVSARGGPRTVGEGANAEVWAAGDKYATFREFQWIAPTYEHGNDNGHFSVKKEGALGRIRADSLDNEYQTLATVEGLEGGLSQSIKEFYDARIETETVNCDVGVYGCMEQSASNYNSAATCPDGGCKCDGKDMAGNDLIMDTSGKCVVVPCTGEALLNRQINTDGSCGACNDGYHGIETCIPKVAQCKLDAWGDWSDCEDGKQTRSRKKQAPPTGWSFGECLPIFFIPDTANPGKYLSHQGATTTLTETDSEIIETKLCISDDSTTVADDEIGDEDVVIDSLTDNGEEIEDEPAEEETNWLLWGGGAVALTVILGGGMFLMRK